jgi:glycosyltransferase involved in cell wall biosynthesis
MNKLKSLASTDQRISFEGEYKSENLSKILNGIDVLVIPNIWYETYSFVLHEAFASNVPVIAADLGVMHEKIADGDYGLLFKPGDSNDLRNKMEQIINNPEILNGMKRNLSCNLIVPTIEQEAYSYREIYRNIKNLPN